MADHNITISNSLNTFGPAPTDLWNEWNWNAFKWGEGTADLQVFVNLIVNTSALAPSSAVELFWNFYISIADASLVLDSSVTPYFYTSINIANTLTPVADMYAESLTDGSGYNYVFPSNVTDAEQRTIPTYTDVDGASTTWTTSTASTTTWS